MPGRPHARRGGAWLVGGLIASLLALSHGLPAGAQPARPEPRLALVIGNASYPIGALRNPANDARAMARTLREVGFEVMAFENLGQRDMRRAVRAFGEKLRDGGGVGLFFFAGHGIQLGGRNFLVPVDAEIALEGDVEVEAIDANGVISQMENARNRTNIIILDACRDNPFASRFRSGAGGLASMEAPVGTLIAFATAPGRTSRDGDGANGVYTAELLKAMRTPGLKLEDVFKQVRQAVRNQTRGTQIPQEWSSLEGDFYFRMPAAPSPALVTTPPPPPTPAPPPRPIVREEVRTPVGSLALTSPVEGAEVFVDGERVGQTRSGSAIVLDNLGVGRHRVTARRPGHKEWEREVNVPAGQRQEVRIDLEAITAALTAPPATIPPTLPLTPPPTRGGTRILHEMNFLATRTETPKTAPPCATRYESTGFVVRNVVKERGTCEYNLWASGRFSTGVRIELSTRLLAGATTEGYGLKFAIASKDQPDDALYFMVSGDGSFKLSRYEKEWKTITEWTRDPRIRTGHGQANDLAVELVGRSIRLFVNGQQVATASIDGEPSGSVGLYLNAPGLEVAFASLRVLDRRALYEMDFVTTRTETPKTTPPCATRYDNTGFVVRNVVQRGTCEYNLWNAGRFSTGVRIELALRLLGGPTDRGFGLKFGIAGEKQSDDALYFMLSGRGGFKLERFVTDWKPLIHWTQEPTHVRSGLGQANDLAVELVGRTIRLFVNGQLVGTTTADREPAGAVGLFLDAPGLEVAFASLKVVELPR